MQSNNNTYCTSYTEVWLLNFLFIRVSDNSIAVKACFLLNNEQSTADFYVQRYKSNMVTVVCPLTKQL